jgi:hypothetical protein
VDGGGGGVSVCYVFSLRWRGRGSNSGFTLQSIQSSLLKGHSKHCGSSDDNVSLMEPIVCGCRIKAVAIVAG